jgi:hypothetical protein
MNKHISLTAMLLLATSQACATFEIKDPAKEIYEEKPASPISAAAIAKRSCADFLLDGAKQSDYYQAELNWVDESVNQGRASGAIEAELRTFCIDNPKVSLGDAAGELGAPAGSE